MEEKNIIYEKLKEHQKCSESWEHKELIDILHRFSGIFRTAFYLDIDNVAIGIERLRKKVLGQCRYGHNALGLEHEILLNSLYLERPTWRLLGTLLHELLHAWQEENGSPPKGKTHNREFIKKAYEYGLVVTRKGQTTYREGLFTELLRENGILVPEDLTDGLVEMEGEKGESKLKKYSCSCTNIRVAKEEFAATCDLCGKKFERKD